MRVAWKYTMLEEKDRSYMAAWRRGVEHGWAADGRSRIAETRHADKISCSLAAMARFS
jgi:hypothetical protein